MQFQVLLLSFILGVFSSKWMNDEKVKSLLDQKVIYKYNIIHVANVLNIGILGQNYDTNKLIKKWTLLQTSNVVYTKIAKLHRQVK